MEPYGLKEPIKHFERRVIIDNIKALICGILTVLLLLGVCMTVDYADDSITINSTVSEDRNVNSTDDVLLADDNLIEPNPKKDKIHIVKNKTKKVEKKLPTISMWAKPSVRCGYPYQWYYRTFVDYCPNCHHYNSLLKNPKGVPENEYTCAICDSDFDGVVGKEKYSWSNVYLRRA